MTSNSDIIQKIILLELTNLLNSALRGPLTPQQVELLLKLSQINKEVSQNNTTVK